MQDLKYADVFDNAVSWLNDSTKKRLEYITTSQKANICEVRLLVNCPLQVVDKNGTHYITKEGKITDLADDRCYQITKVDIEESFRKICGYSVHTHQNEIRNGYITLKGGHRVGICGTAVVDGRNICTVKDISSINLRIAKQVTSAADKMLPPWVINNNRSLIIAGPPSSGKTTLLRDVARKISLSGKRVSVIDERGEICAVYQGTTQNDLGNCCDILNSYPKAYGIMTALRSMSPDVIICDEVGDCEEIQEVKSGLNCGVRFILTAHCHDFEDLVRRPQIKELLESGEFGCLAFLQGGKMIGQPAKIVTIGNDKYEINRPLADSSIVNSVGSVVL